MPTARQSDGHATAIEEERVDPRVRRASVGDAASLARLLHDFNSEFADFTPGVAVLTQRLERLVANGYATILLGGAGPDGLAVLRFRPAIFTEGLDAYLEEFYVAPAVRGRGLGRALLQATLSVAREQGATRIELATSEDDAAARHLYESVGFINREGGPDGPVQFFYERDL